MEGPISVDVHLAPAIAVILADLMRREGIFLGNFPEVRVMHIDHGWQASLALGDVNTVERVLTNGDVASACLMYVQGKTQCGISDVVKELFDELEYLLASKFR